MKRINKKKVMLDKGIIDNDSLTATITSYSGHISKGNNYCFYQKIIKSEE